MTNLFIFAAVGGVIAGILHYWGVMQVVLFHASQVFVKTEQVDVDLGLDIVAYLNVRCRRRWSFGARVYSKGFSYIRPLERYGILAYTNPVAENGVYIYHGAPIALFGTSDKTNFPKFFSYLRGTVNWTRLLREVVDFHDEKVDAEHPKSQRFYVVTLTGSLGTKQSRGESATAEEVTPSMTKFVPGPQHVLLHWKLEDIGEEETSFLEHMSLSPEAQAFVVEARRWRTVGEWCRDHLVPWKLGAAFIGPPGTGKTCLARALAEDMGIPLIRIDLSTMSNVDLEQAWRHVARKAPCIVVVEDVDAVYHGREPLSKDPNAATFDALLQVIDGAERTDGVLTIITTNHPEHVDEALFRWDPGVRKFIPTRPGRVDLIVEFGALDEIGRKKMAGRILDEWPSAAERVVAEGTGDYGAQFQRRCVVEAYRLKFGREVG